MPAVKSILKVKGAARKKKSDLKKVKAKDMQPFARCPFAPRFSLAGKFAMLPLNQMSCQMFRLSEVAAVLLWQIQTGF